MYKLSEFEDSLMGNRSYCSIKLCNRHQKWDFNYAEGLAFLPHIQLNTN